MAPALQYLSVFARRHLADCGAIVLLCIVGLTGAAQEPAPDGAPKRTGAAVDMLDPLGMSAELKRLDEVCERLGLAEEQRLMSRWTLVEPSDAHLLFLPVEADPLAAGARDRTQTGNRSGEFKAAHANWLKHFVAARQKHARYWIAEARRAADGGDEWAAYRHLWRAVREDPDNADAKAALGPLLVALNVRARPRSSQTAHPNFQWPAGSFSRLDTANFQVLSRADAEQTIAVAAQLEQFHALWTQMFFPLWAPPGVIKARLAGRNSRWQKRHQFNVVVCKDRQDYLKALGASEANIGVSVGYYNAQMQLAFFYPDAHLPVTLAHEITHQLLAEGEQLAGRPTAGNDSGYWLVEGTALYMESLADHGTHWRVGGWLAPRLQAARYRALHDGYWNEGAAFSAGGMEQWKADAEISKLYTQAVGLSHFFLDNRQRAGAPAIDEQSGDEAGSATGSAMRTEAVAEAEARRASYYATLVSVYQELKQAGPLLEWLRGQDAQRDYVQFLVVRDQHFQSAVDSELVRELVLTRSQLSADSWRRVGQFENLSWLDVSFSNARSSDLAWLGKLQKLERLSLEGTLIEAGTLEIIASLPHLKELDLSQCKVDDAALRPLQSLQTLETLWLSGTQITSASAGMIESLPKLSFVALDGTAIPAAEAQQLSQRIDQRSAK